MLATGTDPEHQHPTGGVGLIFRKSVRAIQTVFHAEQLQQAQALGRALKANVELLPGKTFTLIVLYGWQGAKPVNDAWTRTNAVLQGLREELQANAHSPLLVLGDLNMEYDHMLPAKRLIDEGLLHDAGAEWSRLSGCPPEGTCRAAGAKQLTRRDYALLNNDAWMLLHGLEVGNEGEFSVHRPLRLTYRAPDGPIYTNERKRLPRLVQLAPDSKEEKAKWLTDIASQVEPAVAKQAGKWHRLLERGRTEQFWQSWSETVEAAALQGATADPALRHSMAGRGKLRTQKVNVAGGNWVDRMKLSPDFEGALPTSSNYCHFRQQRRLVHILKVLRATGATAYTDWPRTAQQALRAYTDSNNLLIEAETLRHLSETAPTRYKLIMGLEAAAKAHATQAKTDTANVVSQRRAETRAKLANKCTGDALAYRCLRDAPLPDICCLVDEGGQPRMRPEEVDRLMRSEWGKVYEGNVENPWEAAGAHLLLNAGHIRSAPPCHMDELSWEMFRDTLEAYRKTAPGLDQWALADLQLLPPSALKWLWRLLRRVEQGAPWPTSFGDAAGVCIGKPGADPLKPLSFRVLTILPIMFRVWGSTVLQRTKPWVDSWRLPSHFSGVPGAGAADCAWRFGYEREQISEAGGEYVAGFLDLYKCFDQIVPQVLWVVMGMSGFPLAAWTAYVQFHAQLQARFALGEHVGEAVSRPTSIPQGDPLSMVLLSFLCAPWLEKMAALGLLAYLLADDLKLADSAPDGTDKFEEGFRFTLRFFLTMGSRISPSKSGIAASSKALRSYFKGHLWPELRQSIPIKLHIRDLGYHWETTDVHCSGTLNARIADATLSARRIGNLQKDLMGRVRLLRGKTLPKAYYGVEGSRAGKRASDCLMAAMADAVVGKHYRNRSPDLVLMFCSDIPLHPLYHVAWLRLSMLRRQLVLWDDRGPDIIHDFDALASGEPGASRNPGPLALVVESLRALGATFSEGCIFTLPNQSACSIPWAPVQELKARLKQAAAETVVAMVRQRRPALALPERVEFALIRKVLRKRSSEDQTLLLATMAGGAWTARARYLAKLSPCQTCPFCQADMEDYHHLLWECPAHQDLRAPFLQVLREPGLLPAGLKHNIFPGALYVGRRSYFWGPRDEGNQGTMHPEEVGLDWPYDQEDLPTWDWMEAARGPTPLPTLELPDLPSLPYSDGAAFTDGGVLNPAWPQLGLGGMAAVWPGRGTDGHTWLEAEWGARSSFADGMATTAALAGLVQNSTRAELGGGLLAMASGRARCIFTDSENFRLRFREVLRTIADPAGRAARRLILKPNHDMLYQMSIVLQHCGLTPEVRHVMAHATGDDILAGRITREEARWNSKADFYAGLALQRGRAELTEQADQARRRYKRWLILLERLHDMALAIMRKAASALPKLELLGLAHSKGRQGPVVAAAPDYAEGPLPGAYIRRRLLGAANRRQVASLPALADWLMGLDWTYSEDEQNWTGFTWMELLLLHECQHGAPWLGADPAKPLEQRLALKGVLRDFAMQVRRCLRDATVEPTDLFQQPAWGRHRLAPLAITGQLSSLRGRPKLTAEECHFITKAVLRQRGGTAADCLLLEEGKLALRPTALPRRALPRWRNAEHVAGPRRAPAAPAADPEAGYLCPGGCGGLLFARGRQVPARLSCPSCGRQQRTSTAKCLFCGLTYKDCPCKRGGRVLPLAFRVMQRP